MHKQQNRNRVIALLLGLAAFAMAGWANADPPTRVARLAYTSGAVSFSPAGEDEWVQATINRPLITGDRLWVDNGARAELQIGSAVIRMGGGTSVTLLNLDDRVAQVQLAQGTLNVRVRRVGPKDVLEVDTPNLAYSIRRTGDYRIDVDPAGNETTVVTRNGQAEVFGEGAAYVVDAGQSYRFAGTGLRDYEYVQAPQPDEFDRWSYDRDRRGDNSVSARYVSRDVIGYEDLDEHGTWRADPGYGNVWIPNRVAAGWAPYRDGHWAWVDPWGWTWVDDAPWGFAVSHYGRWAFMGGTWGWVPGPVRARAVYAPALVAFVGGGNFQLAISTGNVGGVAWFPLGPRDVYRPSYAVSRGYFNNINTTNTIINNTTITNVYNNRNVTNVTYVNQQVPGAVVAVPATAFVQSQQVSKVAVRVAPERTLHAPVTSVAAVAPMRASVSGAAAPGAKPPAAVLERPVVARTAPPAAPVAFASKERLLATNPGKPLDAAQLGTLRRTATTAPAAPAPKVTVAAPTPTAGPVTAPPPQRGQREQRGQSPATVAQPPAMAPAPGAKAMPSAPVAQPAGVTPAAPVTPPLGQREQRGKGEQPPVARPVTPPSPPVASTPPVTPPATLAPPPGQREQRGKGEQPPVARPMAPPSPPVASTPPATPPVSVVPPQGQRDQRGKAEQPPVARPMTPPSPPVASTPPATPPASVVPPQGQRDQRGKAEQPPVARPMTPPSPPAPPMASSPPRAAPPVTRAAEPRPVPQPVAKPPSPAAVRPTAPPPVAGAPGALPPRPGAGTPPPQPDARQRGPEAAKGGQKKSAEQQKQEEEEKKRKP